MARTGRPPRSVEERKNDGTLRPDRHSTTPVVIGGRTRPQPSEYLTPGQREEFEKIVDALEGANILDAADAGMIEVLAIERAKVIVCNAELAGTSFLVENSMGSPMAHPLLAVQEKALVHIRQLNAELGIGPAARARLGNLGVKGAPAAKTLPGMSTKPVALKVVGNG